MSRKLLGMALATGLLLALIADASRAQSLDEQVVASIKSGDLSSIKKQAASGLDLMARDASGWSYLMMAVRYGEPDIIEFLLDRGLDINAQNSSGQTPLMLAILASNKGIVEKLLDRGANLEQVDQSGMSAVDIAEQTRAFDVQKLLQAAGHVDDSERRLLVSHLLYLGYAEGEETIEGAVRNFQTAKGVDATGEVTRSVVSMVEMEYEAAKQETMADLESFADRARTAQGRFKDDHGVYANNCKSDTNRAIQFTDLVLWSEGSDLFVKIGKQEPARLTFDKILGNLRTRIDTTTMFGLGDKVASRELYPNLVQFRNRHGREVKIIIGDGMLSLDPEGTSVYVRCQKL